jgi:hypothetical protein
MTDLPISREQILDALRLARRRFLPILDSYSPDDFQRQSIGTKWTNHELLFHMLFGYLITRTLLLIAPVGSRVPDRFVAMFMRSLSRLVRPFNWINYMGSVIGGRLYSPERMFTRLETVTGKLERLLNGVNDELLAHESYVPTAWDPFFKTRMTIAEIFHYPTQHFRFHEAQLSGPQPWSEAPRGWADH